MKTGKRIPISATKNIGNQFGYTQVIITAFDKQSGITSVSTWGKDQTDCEQAAQGGNFVKKALGWPPEQCTAKPSRQISREKMKKENDELKELLGELVKITNTPHNNDSVNITRYVAISELADRKLKQLQQ